MSYRSWKDVPPSLQARIARGDEDALNELASWAHEAHPCHLSDDVIQLVLQGTLVMMRRSKARLVFKAIESVPALLARIAHRCVQNVLRGTQRHERLLSELERRSRKRQDDPWRPAMHESLDVADFIKGAAKSLDRMEREVVIRVYAKGERYRKLAVALGVPESYLRMVGARARKKLDRLWREAPGKSGTSKKRGPS